MREVQVDQQDTDQVYFQNLQKLEQCIKPIHEAKGIPNDYYTKTEYFDLEKEILFNKCWFSVVFLKDLPQPGSVRPVNYFKNPLLLIRSIQDKKIRVFQKITPHSAMTNIKHPKV